MVRKFTLTLASVLLASTTACHSGPNPASTADNIYFGGDIVTINDAQPTAEALAIKDGKILSVGSRADLEKNNKGATTQMVDLAGKTLTSSFIDPHSHFSDSLSMADRVNVSAPPVGPAKNPAEIVAELQKYGTSKEAGELIVGYGYEKTSCPKANTSLAASSTRPSPTIPSSSFTSRCTEQS